MPQRPFFDYKKQPKIGFFEEPTDTAFFELLLQVKTLLA